MAAAAGEHVGLPSVSDHLGHGRMVVGVPVGGKEKVPGL